MMDYGSTHKEIVLSCIEGNRKAQYDLYKLYSKSLYNTCLRIVKNETDAEDVLQLAFIDIFTKMNTFRFQSSIGAWMKRIVINKSINYLKRRDIRFFESIEEKHERILEDIPHRDHSDEPKWNAHQVKDAIEALPNGYRVIFCLYTLEGYDHEEISEILSISVSTSKSQYSRARKKLREVLGNH